MRKVCFVVLALTLSAIVTRPADAQTFKVASWNIRSGMGAAAVPGFPNPFTATTSNCTDPAQPLNAWGVGVPQAELAKLAADRTVVALALQEAWTCGSPRKVKEALGWASYIPDNQNGTSIVARFGFAGPIATRQLTSDSRTDTMWVIRANVCLDQGCTRSVTVHAAHWGGSNEAMGKQSVETTDYMAESPEPRLLIGDLNVFRNEFGSLCSSSNDTAGALENLRRSGYIDTWPAINGAVEGFTGMANRLCGSPTGYGYKRIDYAWARGLVPVSMTRFAIPAVIGSASPSDHYGVVAEYLVPGGAMAPPSLTAPAEPGPDSTLAGCSYSLPVTSRYVGAPEANWDVAVNTGATCPIPASTDAPWLVIRRVNGTVVQLRALTNTGPKRIGNLTVAGRTYVVTQGSAP